MIVCFILAELFKLALVCLIVGSLFQVFFNVRSHHPLHILISALNGFALLNGAAPYVKRNLLLACAHTVASDRKVEVREMELLRAIADTLECPIPPFVKAMDKV